MDFGLEEGSISFSHRGRKFGESVKLRIMHRGGEKGGGLKNGAISSM